MLLPLCLAVAVSSAAMLLAQPATQPASAAAGRAVADALRVMSFNIRYDNPADGEDRWENRKALLVETIRTYSPDLLGTQEVLAHQGKFLREQLAGYGFVGVGRVDGKATGEFAAIFYRSDRFELVDSGHYWLSEEPTKIASVGWDASLTRMMTWAKLKDRHANGRVLLFVNTHWDHKGERARLESGQLIHRLIGELAAGATTIVTGDFNCTEADAPYAALLGDSLVDTYRAIHPKPQPDPSSFHGFKGGTSGARIDWILSSRDLAVRDAAIVQTSKEGRYPSDHYPVTATLEALTP